MDEKRRSKYYKERAQTSQFVTLSGAVEITGLSAPTLRKFADEQKIASYKTPTGVRMFNKQCLLDMCSNTPGNAQQVYPVGNQKEHFLYARVSSHHQLDDLSRQIEYLQSSISPEEIGHFTVVRDVGSGVNFKRKGLQTILDACLQGTIGKLVIAHRDRLARFAFDLIEYLVENSGGELIVLDDSDQNKSCEQELAEDLLSIVHVFSCKQMGRRRYSKTTKETRVCSKDSDLPKCGTTESTPPLDAHVPVCVQQGSWSSEAQRNQVKQDGTTE